MGIPWIFGLANSVPKIILGSATYNNYWWCELVAGSSADNLLDQIVVGVCFILIMFSMMALIRFVYLSEKRMDQFTSLEDRRNRVKTVQVTYQGLFYIFVWMIIVIPSLVVTLVDELPRGYLIFWAFLFPLQGVSTVCATTCMQMLTMHTCLDEAIDLAKPSLLFTNTKFANTLVYFRPKYVAIRNKRERNSGSRGSMITSVIHVLDVSVPERRVSQLASFVPISFRVSKRESCVKDANANEQPQRKPLGEPVSKIMEENAQDVDVMGTRQD